MYLRVLLAVLALQNMPQLIRGQDLNTLLVKYSDAIERYIMTGYGEGWKHCDLLSVGPSKNRLLFKQKQIFVSTREARSGTFNKDSSSRKVCQGLT